MKIPSDMVAGVTYKTNNYGLLEVVEYHNALNVTVKFIETGYVTTSCSRSIRVGSVKDKLTPIVYGVGFIGDGGYVCKVDGEQTKPYSVWVSMIQRCYSELCQERHPTYKGCTVCDAWHDFQNFADWFYSNYINGYEIDKDVLQKDVENKIYSPSTCLFVSQKVNVIEASAKHYKFISPTGSPVDIYNMREFCVVNGLDAPHMCSVHSGKRSNHKGWTSSKTKKCPTKK